MSDDNPFGKWMQEHGDNGPEQPERERITNLQQHLLQEYDRLSNEWDVSYWGRELTPDERIMRHMIVNIVSGSFYKTFRDKDGCVGIMEPSLTLERMVHVISIAISTGIILARGLNQHGKTESTRDDEPDHDDPPF